MLPTLHLSHGQVAWSLCGGQTPDRRTLDCLRYLRQLGIPFTEEEQSVGTGHRLTYSFDHLIECAVAMYAVRRGTRPRLAAAFLVGGRKALRQGYRDAYTSIPLAAYEAPWVKSRGRVSPTLSDEVFLRVHERFEETGGKIEAMTMEEMISNKAGFGDLVERHPDAVYVLVPLKRVMIEALAWAQIAPESPRGRRAPVLTATRPDPV